MRDNFSYLDETDHSFDFKNAKVIVHGRFREESLMKDAKHLEPQFVHIAT